MVMLCSTGAAARGEGTGNLKLGSEGVRCLILAIKFDAETGFVHKLRGDRGDIGEVQIVVVSFAVIRGFRERGAAGTHVFLMLMPGTEACDEGVLRAELPIDFGHAYPE